MKSILDYSEHDQIVIRESTLFVMNRPDKEIRLIIAKLRDILLHRQQMRASKKYTEAK